MQILHCNPLNWQFASTTFCWPPGGRRLYARITLSIEWGHEYVTHTVHAYWQNRCSDYEPQNTTGADEEKAHYFLFEMCGLEFHHKPNQNEITTVSW